MAAGSGASGGGRRWACPSVTRRAGGGDRGRGHPRRGGDPARRRRNSHLRARSLRGSGPGRERRAGKRTRCEDRSGWADRRTIQ
ncbi:MAG: hypothetical protein F4X23_09020 [Gemmatimonadales bacterium]|nr:hypothetical protein [Gemmatimonadales bacterium]